MAEDTKKKRILVDTDPNLWVSRRDIDDALALLFLMASPEVQIEGITVNFGNVSTPVGYAAARELLERAGRSIPLHGGAESRRDLGKKNDAVEYLLYAAREAPGDFTLLALAPLTNVASASLLDDAFLSNLGGLVVMGGAFRFPFFSFFGEFNFHCDGRAAAIVLASSVPKTMITMDLCSQAVFTERHLDMLKQNDGEMARWIVRFVEPWLAFNKRIFFRKKGFFPWDVVAAATLVDDALFDSNQRTFSIREKGLRRGSLAPLASSSSAGTSPYGACTANVPESLCAERFMDVFLSRLLDLTENATTR
jgi:inosine-uridine nucleoside N-ribohydrolase